RTMTRRPVAPGNMSLGEALGASAPLQGLMERVRDSNARHEALRDLLSPDLLAQLRPGPLDETGWTLLVEHSAAAAKLRQLVPRIGAHLQGKGWPLVEVRLKVRPRGR